MKVSLLPVFLMGMKSLIVVIPILIIIRLAITNYGLVNPSCDRGAVMEYENCVAKLSEFEADYGNWQSANFPSADLPTVLKLKKQCEQIPRCFVRVVPECKSDLPALESLPQWCRRIYFLTGEFSKCAGKVNQISGTAPCANEFFAISFIKKKREEKCEIMQKNKECLLESVTKTCTSTMADVAKMHINTEQTITKC
ncbi:unnamed protein product [Caenorhabditis brenneri]